MEDAWTADSPVDEEGNEPSPPEKPNESFRWTDEEMGEAEPYPIPEVLEEDDEET